MKKSFVIDRSKWRCGDVSIHGKSHGCHGKGDTMLLNQQGYMCCLGQIMRQEGVRDESMRCFINPSLVEGYDSFLVDDGGNSSIATDAMRINDSSYILGRGPYTLESREQELIERFAKDGITLTFEGEYETDI